MKKNVEEHREDSFFLSVRQKVEDFTWRRLLRLTPFITVTVYLLGYISSNSIKRTQKKQLWSNCQDGKDDVQINSNVSLS